MTFGEKIVISDFGNSCVWYISQLSVKQILKKPVPMMQVMCLFNNIFSPGRKIVESCLFDLNNFFLFNVAECRRENVY